MDDIHNNDKDLRKKLEAKYKAKYKAELEKEMKNMFTRLIEVKPELEKDKDTLMNKLMSDDINININKKDKNEKLREIVLEQFVTDDGKVYYKDSLNTIWDSSAELVGSIDKNNKPDKNDKDDEDGKQKPKYFFFSDKPYQERPPPPSLE